MTTMNKMKKHNFAQGVFCKECTKSVQAAWAESYDLARAGQGLCDECHGKASQQQTKARKPATPTIAPDVKKKEEDAVGP